MGIGINIQQDRKQGEYLLRGNKMNNLNELKEQYKDCSVHTSEYVIDGKKYIVKSHFVGNKKLDDVLYRIAFQKAMDEVLKTA